jgi:putative methionine-R-sulfoxide reductase with GAF domain
MQKYDARVLNEIAATASGSGDVASRAKRVAEMIRQASGCYWVGIFEIADNEARAVAWTGSEAPAFLRFPLTRGITRDVVKTARTTIVNDVLKDARYLVAFSTTRAEVISSAPSKSMPTKSTRLPTLTRNLSISALRASFRFSPRRSIRRVL